MQKRINYKRNQDSKVSTRWTGPLMGLVLDSTFDRLANAVQRFAMFGVPNWFHIACCFKFRINDQQYVCIFRLLANKGNSLQRLLSPLMPVSVLLQLSDLVFASDLVLGGFSNWISFQIFSLMSPFHAFFTPREDRSASFTTTCRGRQVFSEPKML